MAINLDELRDLIHGRITKLKNVPTNGTNGVLHLEPPVPVAEAVVDTEFLSVPARPGYAEVIRSAIRHLGLILTSSAAPLDMVEVFGVFHELEQEAELALASASATLPTRGEELVQSDCTLAVSITEIETEPRTENAEASERRE